jgi:hypothetical protein
MEPGDGGQQQMAFAMDRRVKLAPQSEASFAPEFAFAPESAFAPEFASAPESSTFDNTNPKVDNSNSAVFSFASASFAPPATFDNPFINPNPNPKVDNSNPAVFSMASASFAPEMAATSFAPPAFDHSFNTNTNPKVDNGNPAVFASASRAFSPVNAELEDDTYNELLLNLLKTLPKSDTSDEWGPEAFMNSIGRGTKGPLASAPSVAYASRSFGGTATRAAPLPSSTFRGDGTVNDVMSEEQMADLVQAMMGDFAGFTAATATSRPPSPSLKLTAATTGFPMASATKDGSVSALPQTESAAMNPHNSTTTYAPNPKVDNSNPAVFANAMAYALADDVPEATADSYQYQELADESSSEGRP